MAKKLKVQKTDGGAPGVECPRCSEIVAPIYLPYLEYWNCPECDQSFDPSSLKGYQKALKDEEDRDGFGEYDS